MLTLRWGLYLAAITCALVIVQTGRWNGVALLLVLFLAALALTFEMVRDFLRALVELVWVADDPDPQPSRLDNLDGKPCPCPVDHTDACDGERASW